MGIIRIVLAEDHSLMREGTTHILSQYPDMSVVGEAEDGEQAVQMVESLKPDVAILDIRMPKLNGIEVTRKIKEVSPNTKTLILSAYDDDDYIIAAMEAGASGYLLKTTQPRELVDSVRTIQTGEPVLHPSIAAKVARLWSQSQNFQKSPNGEQLSARELDVLRLAAKGLRNKAIAQELHISIRTIEGHFNSIFARLGVTSRVEAVLYALSHRIIVLDKDKT